MADEKRLAANYRNVVDRIAAACRRVGRSPGDVTLIAVTKSGTVPAVNALINLGASELGESRPQQLSERAKQVAANVHWHLIGQLQRNKVRMILPIVRWIHSIDSLRLLRRVDEVAAELNLTPHVLLEINVSGEASKGGFIPDEIIAAWPEVRAMQHAQVSGLMTMAPIVENAEDTRLVFRGLRVLRDKLAGLDGGDLSLPHLSMGMSDDFEIAVEEGATMVRVGSLLFEGV